MQCNWLLSVALFSAAGSAATSTQYQDLPTQVSAMPFFATAEQADQRTAEYNAAITDVEAALDSCRDDDCEQLSLHKDDLEYAISDHQEKNGSAIMSWLGGPGYTPETGLMLAAGGLYSFSTNRDQPQLQRSSVNFFVIGSQGNNGIGYGIRSKQNLFFDNNDRRFSGTLTFNKDSINYWGIGYAKGKAQDASDDTLMNNTSFTYDATYTVKTDYGFYLGPTLRLKYFKADEDNIPLAAQQDSNFLAYQDKPLAVGLGLTINYDSRDVAVNAWQGQFFNFEYVRYDNAVASDSDYQKILLDYRYYHSFKPGRVIALYNALQVSDGDVPYYDMPTLGGSLSLRGLYAGRFRDLNAVEHTAEYRHTFLRNNGNLSAHGMTVWVGLGSIANDLNDLYSDLLYSYGVGYRYELQPRMNVRVDFGVSADDSGFFLTFTEAF